MLVFRRGLSNHEEALRNVCTALKGASLRHGGALAAVLASTHQRTFNESEIANAKRRHDSEDTSRGSSSQTNRANYKLASLKGSEEVRADKRRSDKGDIVTFIKCVIASKRRALNWSAVFSSCCVYLWDWPMRVKEVSMEQRRKARAGETVDPRKKIHRPATSSGTIPTCENPESTPPGIEPCSPSLIEARYRRQDRTPVQCLRVKAIRELMHMSPSPLVRARFRSTVAFPLCPFILAFVCENARVNHRFRIRRVGRKAVQCWDTEIGCAQPARSVYLIFSLWWKLWPSSISKAVLPTKQCCLIEEFPPKFGVGGFSQGSPASPPHHFGAAPYAPQSPSLALKTSILRAAQISKLFYTLPVPTKQHQATNTGTVTVYSVTGLAALRAHGGSQRCEYNVSYNTILLANAQTLRIVTTSVPVYKPQRLEIRSTLNKRSHYTQCSLEKRRSSKREGERVNKMGLRPQTREILSTRRATSKSHGPIVSRPLQSCSRLPYRASVKPYIGSNTPTHPHTHTHTHARAVDPSVSTPRVMDETVRFGASRRLPSGITTSCGTLFRPIDSASSDVSVCVCAVRPHRREFECEPSLPRNPFSSSQVLAGKQWLLILDPGQVIEVCMCVCGVGPSTPLHTSCLPQKLAPNKRPHTHTHMSVALLPRALSGFAHSLSNTVSWTRPTSYLPTLAGGAYEHWYSVTTETLHALRVGAKLLKEVEVGTVCGEVLRADEGEVRIEQRRNSEGGGEKTCRQAASSGTIPRYENLGATRRESRRTVIAQCQPPSMSADTPFKNRRGSNCGAAQQETSVATAGGRPRRSVRRHEEKYAALLFPGVMPQGLSGTACKQTYNLTTHALPGIRTLNWRGAQTECATGRAAEVYRSDCSPRVPAGSLTDVRTWVSCRTMPLVDGFSPRRHSGAAPYSPHPHRAHECGTLSLWWKFLDFVKLCLHEVEEYPGSRTLAGLQKSWKSLCMDYSPLRTRCMPLENSKLQYELLTASYAKVYEKYAYFHDVRYYEPIAKSVSYLISISHFGTKIDESEIQNRAISLVQHFYIGTKIKLDPELRLDMQVWHDLTKCASTKRYFVSSGPTFSDEPKIMSSLFRTINLVLNACLLSIYLQLPWAYHRQHSKHPPGHKTGDEHTYVRTSLSTGYNPFTVTSLFSEALLKFYFQYIPPPRANYA
ncbi:hypothetical protein PR048_024990 [Dryococelus australis]|uniref:Uncharacterized protein n=1 Tax=Dryococelus australis TaxID=614101 RepID=A0ABQ9GQ87_9NEOP|nr:hypothetical protein PR048_024990 [Dryococelus australis]